MKMRNPNKGSPINNSIDKENITLGWAFSRFDFIGPVGPGIEGPNNNNNNNNNNKIKMNSSRFIKDFH